LSSTPQGDLQIDDSLLEDDDDDGDVDADADQALKSLNLRAIKSGVLREYSKGVLEEIKTMISTRVTLSATPKAHFGYLMILCLLCMHPLLLILGSHLWSCII